MGKAGGYAACPRRGLARYPSAVPIEVRPSIHMSMSVSRQPTVFGPSESCRETCLPQRAHRRCCVKDRCAIARWETKNARCHEPPEMRRLHTDASDSSSQALPSEGVQRSLFSLAKYRKDPAQCMHVVTIMHRSLPIRAACGRALSVEGGVPPCKPYSIQGLYPADSRGNPDVSARKAPPALHGLTLEVTHQPASPSCQGWGNLPSSA